MRNFSCFARHLSLPRGKEVRDAGREGSGGLAEKFQTSTPFSPSRAARPGGRWRPAAVSDP